MSEALNRPPAEIRRALTAAFARPPESPVPDADFDALARAIFAWQYENNPPFAAYCNRRGRQPANVREWTEIPAVPTAAFREVALVAGPAEQADAVFRTSGTTRGTERRGEHYIPDIQFYHQSLLPNFAAMLLPDGIQPTMLSLIPPPRDVPDSSLSHMVATVMEQLGSRRSAWYMSVANGIDSDGLATALRDAQETRQPVCILGTSF